MCRRVRLGLQQVLHAPTARLRTLVLLSFFSAAALNVCGRDWGLGGVALVTFLPLLHVLWHERRSARTALATAITGIPAVVITFEGALHMSVSAFVLLVITQVAWYALPGLGVARIHRRWGRGVGLLALPFLWVATEYVAGSRLLWGAWASPISLAYTQTDTALLLAARWSGASGVTFLLLLFNVALYLLLAQRRFVPLATSIILTAAAVLMPLRAGVPEEDALHVAIAQGAYTNGETLTAKFDAETQDRLLHRYRRLTEAAARQRPDLVVWPESSVPMIVYEGVPYPTLLEALEPADAALVGGLLQRRGRDYNVAFLWQDRRLTDVYRKRSPVPLMESWVTPGETARPVSIGGLRLGVAICVESAYAALIRDLAQAGAEALVVLTNDTALGTTNLPVFHLKADILRAVETGRYVVHASQSGPSALISDRGDVLARSALGEEAVLHGLVEARRALTPYVRFGDVLGFLSTCLSLGAVALALLFSVSSTLSIPSTSSMRSHRPWRKKHGVSGEAGA